MKDCNAYLNFDGNTREAMTFYRDCFDAELNLTTWEQAPMDCPVAAKDHIMHARLTKGSTVIMASDCPPGTPLTQGNNFSININCDSMDEIQKLFAALFENGKVVMPLQDMFWGDHWGMVTDQFGVSWMFDFPIPKV